MTEDGFSPQYYLDIHSDLQTAYGKDNLSAAAEHYKVHGIEEGRTPNPFFDPHFYMAEYGDLRTAFGPLNYTAAIRHWLEHGIREGRRGSKIFDPQFYLAKYSDVHAATNGTFPGAYDHFIRHGLNEKRDGANYSEMTSADIPLRNEDGSLNPKHPCSLMLRLAQAHRNNNINGVPHGLKVRLWDVCRERNIIPDTPPPSDPRPEHERDREFRERDHQNAGGERYERRVRDGREYA